MVTKAQMEKVLDAAFCAVLGPDWVLGNVRLSEPLAITEWSKKELEEFAKMGMTIQDIADAKGVSYNAAWQAARKRGVKFSRANSRRLT